MKRAIETLCARLGVTLCLLLGLALLPAQAMEVTPKDAAAQEADKLTREAPHLVIWIDASGSSPVYSSRFVAEVWKALEPQIVAWPLGGTVFVYEAGDATITPRMARYRVQARASKQGMPAEQIARIVRSTLQSYVRNPDKNRQGASALTGAMFDASRMLNFQATRPNKIIALTDGYEFTDRVDCASNRCALGAPAFSVPKGTELIMYGLGLGGSDAKAAELDREWRRFAKLAGFAKPALYRTF